MDNRTITVYYKVPVESTDDFSPNYKMIKCPHGKEHFIPFHCDLEEGIITSLDKIELQGFERDGDSFNAIIGVTYMFKFDITEQEKMWLETLIDPVTWIDYETGEQNIIVSEVSDFLKRLDGPVGPIRAQSFNIVGTGSTGPTGCPSCPSCPTGPNECGILYTLKDSKCVLDTTSVFIISVVGALILIAIIFIIILLIRGKK
jgi:hypothetical protein